MTDVCGWLWHGKCVGMIVAWQSCVDGDDMTCVDGGVIAECGWCWHGICMWMVLAWQMSVDGGGMADVCELL